MLIRIVCYAKENIHVECWIVDATPVFRTIRCENNKTSERKEYTLE